MTTRYFDFYCPVKILSGVNALEHLPVELAERDSARPMVLTDAGVRGAGLLGPLENACAEGGLALGPVFDAIPPDGDTAVVAQIAHLWREAGCDALIAVGGGSVMDTAKAANILVSEGGDDLTAYAGVGRLKRPLRPLVAIATTAGTGSEVTSVAVIKDLERQRKMPFQSPHLFPDLAVIDPRMTMTVPPQITAATAMDALTHATEAYTCLAKNPLSDAYASAAIRRIAEALPRVLAHPDDLDGRLSLAEAATMAGIAFSNSMVGLVHAIGHALGAACHLHHGTCMSLLLPHVLEYNHDAIADLLGELLLPLAGEEAYAVTPPAQRARAAIGAIRKLREDAHAATGLPRTLAETGKVQKDDLPSIARAAVNDGALIMNPVEADIEEIEALLERAWDQA